MEAIGGNSFPRRYQIMVAFVIYVSQTFLVKPGILVTQNYVKNLDHDPMQRYCEERTTTLLRWLKNRMFLNNIEVISVRSNYSEYEIIYMQLFQNLYSICTHVHITDFKLLTRVITKQVSFLVCFNMWPLTL